jgi:hypothetical protein
MKRFIPLIVILLLALVLAIVFDNFVSQVIVEPLLYITWLIGLILTSMPQFVFWLLFVLAALVILARSFHLDFTASRQSRTQSTRIMQGVITPWQRLLRRAERQPYARRHLASSLAKLSKETLSFTDPLNADDTQSLTAFIATLPPEIAAYFQAELQRKPAGKVPWYKRSPIRREVTPKLDSEMIVEFLEKETAWESDDE